SNIMDSDAMSIEALNYQVFDSDTIYVPRAPYFYIHGAVKNPGYYKIEPGLTIERAIIIGGGHTKMASRDQIEIKREGNKKELFFNINSKEAPGPSAKTIDFYEVRIQKDDVLFIPEVGSFYVYGEAGKPGAYKFEKGMSVIKALSIAGGTQNASKQIRITRKVGDEETTFKTDLNALIKEDDILIVRESLF
ncbi:MAG: SLBB domain-containing protein, partial [Nitrospinota bacterium]